MHASFGRLLFMASTLKNLLGLNKIAQLQSAWSSERAKPVEPKLSSLVLYFAVVVALLPSLAQIYQEFFPKVDYTTVAVGTAALLAMLFRLNSQIRIRRIESWSKALSVTHTAFALGCIPFVILVLVTPESLVEARNQVYENSVGGTKVFSRFDQVLFILKVSVWAGLTEEIIFRGLLVSAVRRYRGFSSPLTRDLAAIVLSGVLFGMVHVFTWGPTMGLALAGLGAGFALAYIANGEHIMPLIVYHIGFDCLSLAISTYL